MGLLDKFRKKVDKKRLESKQSKKEEILDLSAKKTESGKKIAAKIKKEDTGRAYSILLSPLITEKLTAEGKYGFKVDSGANKIEIARAIEKVYGVRPQSVNIVNMLGKKIGYGKVQGVKSDWKKAIVTLKKGDKIDIIEG
jgi:large subunit ribosomal protein L23